MSMTDESPVGTAAAGEQSPPAMPAFRCEAHELKTILRQIASHITEADRRHSDALGAMQQRLAVLGRDAAEARSRLPAKMALQLDRIDDDMAALAERLADAEAEAGFETGAGSPAPRSPAGAGGMPAHEDEPWDRVSAEALASVYEAEAAHFGGWAPGVHEKPARAMPCGGVAAAEASPASERERHLIEERCAEIAQRVEQALVEIRRECAFVELGSRFERVERSVGAIADKEGHGAREALARIEAQIAEIASRFDAVQAEAQRLDGIEAELRDLARRMSDERMAEAFGKAVATAPAPAPDAMAQLIADRVCAQLPQSDEIRSEERRRLDELQKLVESLFSERRDGDAQTASVLETMQQAMIRLLDRMDAVEEAAAPVAMSGRPFHDDAPAADAAAAGKRAPAATDFEQWTAGPGQENAPTGESREPKYDPAIFHMYPDPASPPRRQSEAERGQTRGARSQPADADPASWRGDQTGYAPPQHEVEGVVAAARRVMRSSPQAQAGEESSERTGPPKPGESARSAGLIGRIRMPSRLFIATIALVLAGATFAIATVMRKQVVEAPAQHRLLAPPGGTTGGDPGQDAGRRESGRKTDRVGEPQQHEEQQGSGDRVPALKQRNGEPPPKMPALAADQLEWGKAQLNAFEASSAGTPAPVSPSGAGPGDTISGAEVFARRANNRAPQETGSIGPAAEAARLGTALPPAAVGPNSLRVAAAGGDPSAAFEVGTRLAEGRGVTQDFEQAALWYQRAAARGFAPAQYRLATLLESGLGVSSDLSAARGWYLKAAEQGHAKAMHNAAVLSIGGDRGQTDYVAAIDWFTKAAEHGIADSQYNLGVLYETGLGSPRDLKLAYQWFALAAQAGDGEAVRRRDLLRARIATEDLQEADRAILSWRAKPADPLVNDPRTAGSFWQRTTSASAAAGAR